MTTHLQTVAEKSVQEYMQEDEAIKADFAKLVERKQYLSFIHPVIGDRSQLLEAVAMLNTGFAGYDGTDALRICSAALTDCNFHPEAQIIENMITKLESQI
jgi:hypothetical protein